MYKADSRAFTRWLKHVANRDTDGTVLMIQIENEIGMLESRAKACRPTERRHAICLSDGREDRPKDTRRVCALGENGSDSPDAPAVKGYAKLLELMPILARHQGQGSMNGLYFDNDSTEPSR